jgi:hypothetical protein
MILHATRFSAADGYRRRAYLTGIVVSEGTGTAVTLFFALPVAIRSL